MTTFNIYNSEPKLFPRCRNAAQVAVATDKAHGTGGKGRDYRYQSASSLDPCTMDHGPGFLALGSWMMVTGLSMKMSPKSIDDQQHQLAEAEATLVQDKRGRGE